MNVVLCLLVLVGGVFAQIPDEGISGYPGTVPSSAPTNSVSDFAQNEVLYGTTDGISTNVTGLSTNLGAESPQTSEISTPQKSETSAPSSVEADTLSSSSGVTTSTLPAAASSAIYGRNQTSDFPLNENEEISEKNNDVSTNMAGFSTDLDAESPQTGEISTPQRSETWVRSSSSSATTATARYGGNQPDVSVSTGFSSNLHATTSLKSGTWIPSSVEADTSSSSSEVTTESTLPATASSATYGRNQTIDFPPNENEVIYKEDNDISTSTAGFSMFSSSETTQISDASTQSSLGTDTSFSSSESTTSIPSTSTTEAPKCDQIPKIANLNVVDVTSFTATLQWDPPENKDCVDEYVIYLNNEEYNRTTEMEEEITNLNACEEYKIGIAILYESEYGNSTEDTFKTKIPNVFNYTVQNLTITRVSSDNLNVTWQPPIETVEKCVTGYSLVWWDQNNTGNGGNGQASDIFYMFTSIIPCYNYAIMVTPKVGSNEGRSLTEKFLVESEVQHAPVLIRYNTGKTYVTTLWQTDDKTKNLCKIQSIIVTCESSIDNTIVTSTTTISTTSPSFRYNTTIEGLAPFTNYTCFCLVNNEAGNSSATGFDVTTAPDVPSEPRSLTITNIGPDGFTIGWTEPIKIPGIMTGYGLRIAAGERNVIAKECSNNASNHDFDVDAQTTSYDFREAIPYHNYTVSLYGIVKDAGNGSSTSTQTTTAVAKPDDVENPEVSEPSYTDEEVYHGKVTVTFQQPCNYNGPFKSYSIRYVGKREGYGNHSDIISTSKTESAIELQPERDYSIEIGVITEDFESWISVPKQFHSRPGVPILNGNLTKPSSNDTTKAYMKLSKSAFDDTNGEILYYAVIVLPSSYSVDKSYGFWDGVAWPTLSKSSEMYQITPELWNPFQDGKDTVEIVIGDGNCADNYCNKPLKEDTKYKLIVRALTSATYRDSPLLDFKTDALEGLNLALILGLTFGLLALLLLILFIIFLKRKKKTSIADEEKRISSTLPDPIPCKKFATYYDTIKENYNILKQQYTVLGTQSKEIVAATTYSTLPENRRKNRYTNILPYDGTRVKLKIDEDDEIGSDYINASYIKGYSGEIEYIATQGPLEATTKDFWKMIIQENITVIVMVSQFIEQSKEKCYQYFPNNHETVTFGESLEVRCSTELHFGTYCVRTLQVKKDAEQRNIIHMQFLEWPDFGVPQGTDNMLLFCRQMREKIISEGGLIAVHCSAGVGRTGTIIALDILLQAIDDHRDINIYKTVLDLRKQRVNMVQTEKQYMFIHTCIKEYLEMPKIPFNEKQHYENTYENLDVLRSSMNKNLIETEVESAL